MTDTRDPDLISEEGRPAAAVVWLLYILSIPSAGVLAVVGLIVAYVSRGSAQGWVRSHFDQQIRIFWQSFWWHVIPWVVVGLLSLVLIGLLLLWVPFVISFVLLIWFTVKSVLGMVDLLNSRPVR
ncbi:hypothetical protein [Brevundimonas sp.]|uniref:hypothetical protein n=1 Tax=Brevundimonas sp. TaxID=1871086 RepID=UPI0025CFA27B|nr:hypothetical protein [Brevundimonas sp.]